MTANITAKWMEAEVHDTNGEYTHTMTGNMMAKKVDLRTQSTARHII